MSEKQEILLNEVKQRFLTTLSEKQGTSEATSLYKTAASNILNCAYEAVALKGNEVISLAQSHRFNEVIVRLQKNEPIQYILNEAYFLDLKLELDSSVLIPRPETEELATLIIRELGPNFSGKILDIGTGSGCIALALQHAFPKAKVCGIDVSEAAIKVAKKNAENLKLNATFSVLDMHEVQIESYDIVVSNPPYIGNEEANEMEPHVLDFEPRNALFVPNNQPTYFYYKIATLIKQGNKACKVFLELNPLYANQIASFYIENGFDSVEIVRDFYEKDRMLTAAFKAQ